MCPGADCHDRAVDDAAKDAAGQGVVGAGIVWQPAGTPVIMMENSGYRTAAFENEAEANAEGRHVQGCV